jgi:hypothetical protein
MKSLGFVSQGLGALALLALAAGCGSGAPSPLAPSSQTASVAAPLLHPATNPQRVLDRLASRSTQRVTGPSRMSPAAKTSVLLYVANTGATTVNVYLASTWSPLGELLGFTSPYAMCVDGAQNVYVPDFANEFVREYAHGAIAPARTLADHQGSPAACAVDPNTGNLAISNFMGPSSTSGNVIVYQAAKGTPIAYAPAGFANCFMLAYDNNDNLFVDGRNSSGTVLLAELPKGKNAFRSISMNQAIGFPGGVAWDGEFLAVGDQLSSTIYQFKVANGKATVQGSTVLAGATDVFQFFLTGSTSKHPQATGVLGADFGASTVGKWDYPAGGTPLKALTGLDGPEGVVLSQ